MKCLLSILCLFVLSCDSGGDGDATVHGCLNSGACNYNEAVLWYRTVINIFKNNLSNVLIYKLWSL